jgi:hypothetical protein
MKLRYISLRKVGSELSPLTPVIKVEGLIPAAVNHYKIKHKRKVDIITC